MSDPEPLGEPRPLSRPSTPPVRAVRAEPGCTVVVCHGPVCADPPHSSAELLHRLGPVIAATRGAILIRSVGCLNACPYAPVLVITRRQDQIGDGQWSHPAGGRRPDITVWATATDPDALELLAGWIQAGGQVSPPSRPSSTMPSSPSAERSDSNENRSHFQVPADYPGRAR